MIKKNPTGIDSRPQRWIMGIVNGRVRLIHMIGPCALVIAPEDISKIILVTEWVGG